jgi:hypothetical protein
LQVTGTATGCHGSLVYTQVTRIVFKEIEKQSGSARRAQTRMTMCTVYFEISARATV